MNRDTLRFYEPGDAARLYALFYEAVHHGTAPHYTPAQQHAWAARRDMPPQWAKNFDDSTTWIAEDANGFSGFLTLNDDGYLNLLYVRPDRRGKGTANRLYARASDHARDFDLSMTTHASLLARPFFERHGWRIVHAEEVSRGDQRLKRFFMTAAATE